MQNGINNKFNNFNFNTTTSEKLVYAYCKKTGKNCVIKQISKEPNAMLSIQREIMN